MNEPLRPGHRFLELLATDGPLIADGAMGTSLMAAGLEAGDELREALLRHAAGLRELLEVVERVGELVRRRAAAPHQHRVAEQPVLEGDAAAHEVLDHRLPQIGRAHV